MHFDGIARIHHTVGNYDVIPGKICVFLIIFLFKYNRNTSLYNTYVHVTANYEK